MAVPVIQNFSPVGPTPPLAAASVSFDVVDTDPGVPVTFVFIVFPDRTEVAFNGGSGFTAPYTGTSITVGSTTSFTIFKGSGWEPEAFSVTVIAADQGSNLESGAVAYNATVLGTWPPDMQPFTAGAQP